MFSNVNAITKTQLPAVPTAVCGSTSIGNSAIHPLCWDKYTGLISALRQLLICWNHLDARLAGDFLFEKCALLARKAPGFLGENKGAAERAGVPRAC